MNAPFQTRRDNVTRIADLPARPTHDARLLTAGGTEATIVLDSTVYVLHITRQGKLILTK
ncbi:MAG: hemin uptake protein HemP [Rhodovulum sulfidophilum]|uniref:Hemin uptake protein HemP n=1 Tax=Rhodovulum sulfidophilum TaxID=35806 RepID=A0A2W5Q4X5_RHOSU|nr:MAG: hemin uptake protein HemP [Rhodovulum sulfidophilum]